MSAPGLQLALPALTAASREQPVLEEVAREVADRIAAGGRLLTFGAGHSHSLAAELCMRAGGLTAVTSMSLEDLRTEVRPAHMQLRDSEPERNPANGPALLKRYEAGLADALLIASQSGRNGASVEMARAARAAGIYTTVLVSRAHSAAFPSRHPDGLKLVDVADAVIDNHCPVGDAAVIAGGEAVSAASTVAGALLVQVLNALIVADLAERGAPGQVIRSANVDAGR